MCVMLRLLFCIRKQPENYGSHMIGMVIDHMTMYHMIINSPVRYWGLH